MRRRPTAVYRVLDEEDLLFGTDYVDEVVERVDPPARRGVSRRAAGVCAGVLVLAVVVARLAGVLLAGGWGVRSTRPGGGHGPAMRAAAPRAVASAEAPSPSPSPVSPSPSSGAPSPSPSPVVPAPSPRGAPAPGGRQAPISRVVASRGPTASPPATAVRRRLVPAAAMPPAGARPVRHGAPTASIPTAGRPPVPPGGPTGSAGPAVSVPASRPAGVAAGPPEFGFER
jgi:hypothetical protein